MKLKIKVKTLIGIVLLSLFVVLIVAPLLNLTIATYLNEKDSDKAEAFYNNYMASPIKLNEKQALYGYGESLVKGYEKFTIKFSGWGGGERTSPENMDKAMEAFEKSLLKHRKKDFTDGYKDTYSIRAYTKLLDTSIATLDTDKLLYWIDWGRDDENEKIRYISKLYKAYYHFVQKDYNVAKEILEGLNEREFDRKYYELMGDINLNLGNIEKAREYYGTSVENNTFSSDSIFFGYFGGSTSYLGDYEAENYIDKYQGDYKIKGRVSHDGKGLPFVELYLSEDIGIISTGGVKPDAITDGNGEFEILGLKQGVYDIGIGIHPSQLYNKVFLRKDIWSIELNSDMEFDFEFVTPMKINHLKENAKLKDGEALHISWEPVEGADHYKVESIVFSDPKGKMGSSATVPLRDKNGEEKLKDNSIDFNTENLDKRIMSLTWSGEEEIINPLGILGSIIPEVEYPIIVNAYNKEGDKIGSSLTLISDYEDMVSIEVDGTLTEGEKLILDRKYREAISCFEERLKENPKDKESLLYLARFYSIGWKRGEKDIPKAVKYAEVYDREYGDYNLSREVLGFMNSKEMRGNKELAEELLEKIPEEDRDTDYYYKKGMYYVIGGDYLKAREYYEKMTDYKYMDVFYIDMYLGDYKKAISTLESENFNLFKMNKSKTIEILRNIGSIPKEDMELLKKLLKRRIDNDLTRDEEISLYQKTLKSASNLELKKLLNEIGKEEYWEIDY